MFIVNLAIADMCVTLFVDVFSTIGIKKGEVYFHNKWALCEMVASVCLTSCFCSLLSIAGISFNRFIHICYHHLYDKMFTFKRSLCMIFGLWVTSFLMEMPSFFGWGDHVYDRKTLSCIWDRTHSFSYTLFFAICGVAIPWLLTTILYIKIFRYVNEVRRNACSRTTAPSELKQIKERSESMKLARTLFVIFVAFTLCWTPYAMIVVLDVNDVYAPEIHSYFVLMAHTNSSINSVIYCLTNSRFRKAYSHIFTQILFCIKCKCSIFPTKKRSKLQGRVPERVVMFHDNKLFVNPQFIDYSSCLEIEGNVQSTEM